MMHGNSNIKFFMMHLRYYLTIYLKDQRSLYSLWASVRTRDDIRCFTNSTKTVLNYY